MTTTQRPTRTIAIVTAMLVCLGVGYYIGTTTASSPQSAGDPTQSPTIAATSATPSSSVTPSASPNSQRSDEILAQLFDARASDVQVSGVGWVTRVLADDNDGSRHQRFILELNSGQTLLVAHNIDLAPRLDGLASGDEVAFNGEYVYTEQGGTIHWTHHDPNGSHQDGWLTWNGKKSQ